MTSLQFRIPRRAADAVNFPALRARARAAGVPHAAIEYSTRDAGPGGTRVTCSLEMALVLVDEVVALARQANARGDAELVMDCMAAAKAAVEVIGDQSR